MAMASADYLILNFKRMKNQKLLKVANVRERMDAYYRGEISYSRAVELLNEDANKALAIADVSPSLPSSEEFELALIKTPAEEPKLSNATKHMSKRYTAGFYTGMKWAILLRQ